VDHIRYKNGRKLFTGLGKVYQPISQGATIGTARLEKAYALSEPSREWPITQQYTKVLRLVTSG